ncbi:MAG TPA: hypothetical protein VHZ03_14105 [Trebonia sp.]|nr:hypothetical protein [Trebonia sp.]
MPLTALSRQRKRRGEPRRTAVYQAYGEAERLLYVGKSWDLECRLDDHRRYTSWWHEVRRVDCEWLADQWIAADIETFLIRTADPVYNIQCRGGPLQRNATRGRYGA